MVVVMAACETRSSRSELPLAPGSVVLSADDQVIEVGGASTTVQAILYDIEGKRLSEGFGVLFAITMAPSMTGEERPSFEYVSTEDSALFSIEVITDGDATASVELYSGTAPGPVRVKAASLDNTDVFAEDHLVTIAVGGPASIVLSASDQAIKVGGENTIVQATILDEFYNNIGEGYGVRLEITEVTVVGLKLIYFLDMS
jgi:hypothetical protein